MSGVNKVIIIGHLGKDPETRYTPSGDPICNVSIATSESWRDKATGEKKEVTEWHKVVFYRKLAEIAGQYLKKGSLAYVEGKLKTRKWTDKEGQDRYTTEIEANELTMLGGGSDGNRLPATPPADNRRPQPAAAGHPKNPTFDDLDSDLPFVSCDMSHDMIPQLARRMARYG